MADEIIAMTMKYRPVPILKLDAAGIAPRRDDGETHASAKRNEHQCQREGCHRARNDSSPGNSRYRRFNEVCLRSLPNCLFHMILPAAEIGRPENAQLERKFLPSDLENLCRFSKWI